jgi:hypothetical protein
MAAHKQVEISRIPNHGRGRTDFLNLPAWMVPARGWRQAATGCPDNQSVRWLGI